MPRLHLLSAARTDTGIVRDHNEDAVLEHPQAGLYAVADGMGGHSAGDLAAHMIVDSLADVAPEQGLAETVDDVDARLENVNERLHTLARERRAQTIGSTVAALVLRGAYAIAMWVGDSRIYRLRDGRLAQVSEDHALVTELLNHGVITAEQASNHPHGNLVTRAVGASDPMHLDLEVLDVEDGDLFLLCSDGLDKELDDEEIRAIASGDELVAIVDALIERTLERGARDNVSVVAVRAVAGDGENRSLTPPATDLDGIEPGEDTLPDFSLEEDPPGR